MNKLFIILVTVLIFSGCTKKEEKINTQTKPVEQIENKTDTLIKKEKQEEIKTGIENLRYDIDELGDNLKFEGKVENSAEWNDKNGYNLIILTTKESPKKQTSNGEYASSKKLYAYHFINVNNQAKELWKIQDLIDNCEFDLTLEFLPKPLMITDIDNDGIAESTILYKLTCRSDVSPAEMKLIMHEGKEKYAIRGEMLVEIPQTNEKYGGTMKVDKSFDAAPKEFLDFAKKQWEKNKKETFN